MENSKQKFSWGAVQRALDSDLSAPYARYEYTKADGSPLSKIIGAEAERVASSQASPKRRETCSEVFHVYDGTGYSEITDDKGNTAVLNWTRSDTFAVPAWSWVVHHSKVDNSYLFSFSDKPLVCNLGLYHSETL